MAEKSDLWAFPGLHYFKDDPVDRQLFFGRKTEIKELSERILAENLTVLFGKSGDGKTSLINAGLKETFRDMNYLPVQARIFSTPEKLSPIATLYDCIKSEAAEQKLQLPGDWQKPTLWESFWGLRPTEENALKPIVLILDQFEELFTLMAARGEEQEEFIRQFADLVRGRVPEKVRAQVRSQLSKLKSGSREALQLERLLYGSTSPLVTILISLREDYLAFLDNLGKRIPKVYHSRYRLPSLTIAQARDAILNPPQGDVLGEQKFKIDQKAVDAIISFLTVQSSASGITEDRVGPPQLQVLCRQLEEQMRQQGRHSIELDDLGGDKGMRKLLSRFYRDITGKFKLLRLGSGPRKLKGLFGLLRRLQPLHSPRLAVRQLCEDRLITAGGNRNSRHEDEIIREVGVSKADLQQLVDSRLLRREPRLQESFYELSHDSLVPSLQTAGGVRKGWVMSLNLTFIAVLIFASFQWGLPFLQSTITIKNLNTDLAALQGQEITVEFFKLQLARAERTVGDPAKIAGIREQYNDWRKTSLQDSILALHSPYLVRADSLLDVLRLEYPEETIVIDSLNVALLQRKVDEVRQRYNNLVHVPGVKPTENNYETAVSLLDSAYVALEKDVRITELQSDLAELRGEVQQQKQLAEEVKRQRGIGSTQLKAAIQVREPANMTLKGYSSTKATQGKIVLKSSQILQSARVFANETEMSSQAIGKETFKRGTVTIPPAARQVKVAMRAIDKEGNEVSKDLTFKIDRMPLRSEALQELTAGQVTRMVKKFDFYHGKWDLEWDNPGGKGIIHDYEETVVQKERVLIDRATGLMWQQGGSSEGMNYEKAQEYIADLNRRKIGGFDDWRLPTLEEAMTLMEPQKQSNGLYIEPIFDKTQRWIWTADRRKASFAWVVNFYYGRCYDFYHVYGDTFVRAVR